MKVPPYLLVNQLSRRNNVYSPPHISIGYTIIWIISIATFFNGAIIWHGPKDRRHVNLPNRLRVCVRVRVRVCVHVRVCVRVRVRVRCFCGLSGV